jgi:hypothetical protein
VLRVPIFQIASDGLEGKGGHIGEEQASPPDRPIGVDLECRYPHCRRLEGGDRIDPDCVPKEGVVDDGPLAHQDNIAGLLDRL